MAHMFLGLRRAAAMVLVFAWGFAGSAAAMPGDWASRPFQYVAVDQGVRDVLRELSAAAAVPIDVSDAVRGQVRGRWPEMSAGEFLDVLARTYALQWYFDGAMLTVSALSENQTKLLPLHGVELERLRDGLATAGLMDERFGLRSGPVAEAALVSGPPRFVAMAQQALEAMVASDNARPRPKPAVEPTEQRIAVFRGSSATSVSLR